nr:MAG TPA: hypothetical protein [Corticoviridae sp.]
MLFHPHREKHLSTYLQFHSLHDLSSSHNISPTRNRPRIWQFFLYFWGNCPDLISHSLQIS